ncbi:rhodanese-like domain-containing protein [Winogradskyella sp. 4-2091]|uniref:rhodanese-like domain-containing protein n=1 Tax=Winogradskyella sp. 4-2091 TaxID=3381659 RepID=UPI00389258CB
MKTIKIITSLIILSMLGNTAFAQNGVEKINYNGFVELSDSLKSYRKKRLINEATFNIYRQEPKTIILDTRSKSAFDEIHIQGAIHINFSDFTKDKLEAIIPDKTIRILIYCNNNFESKKTSLLDKNVRLALNIPTFINLYGYEYKNIFELKGYLKEDETIIPLITNEKK